MYYLQVNDVRGDLMDWFNIIKSFYDNQLWTSDQVSDAVTKGKITADQYKLITGNDYVAV